MYISLPQKQYFDDTGFPLSAGRISVFLHGSDTPANIYTLEGDDYVVAQNPMRLSEDGRTPSIWFETAVVDVKVEKYNNLEDSYELVDTYSEGFVLPNVHNDTLIYGIDALAEANPELGSVTVVGYHNDSDCGPRVYVWDPTCTDAEDGGCIVASSGSADGRWLLVSDLKYLPSSYYGIVPGSNEANISAFLSYQTSVGQWGIKMPPVPRFLPGTYTSTGTMMATKTLAFDRGAKFTKMVISCINAEVAPNADYVCDFQFTDKQVVAESNWFRTVDRFWTCNARELHQSAVNYFVSNELTSSHGVAHRKITGRPMTITGTGRLMLSYCDVAPQSLSNTWFLEFSGMSFTDRWFTVNGDWDFGAAGNSNRIICSMASNVVELANIDDPTVYELICTVNGRTSVDFENRHLPLVVAAMPFTTISNAIIDVAHFTHDIVLDNCVVYDLRMESPTATLNAVKSTVNLTAGECKAIYLRNSSITFKTDIDTYDTAFGAVDSVVDLTEGSLTRQDPADHMTSSGTSLQRCSVTGGTIDNNLVVIENCDINDCYVTLFPQGGVGTYTLIGRFVGNTWSGASKLRLAPGIDDSSSFDVYDVSIGMLVIKNNTFLTSQMGVYCPFWAQDMEHRFMLGACSSVDVTNVDATWVSGWVYQGNTGSCPDSYGDVAVANFNDNLIKQVSFGSGTHDTVRFVNGICKVFAMPVMQSDGGSMEDDEWVIADTAKAVTPYKALAVPYNPAQSDRTARFPSTMYIPLCAIDKTLTNDMFTCYLGGSGALLLAGAVPVPAVQ